mmetsp:Transcript_66905/g.116428  ORF Transcript_66905/g.116428 Transcript_66905/m.116428 type:complete len:212 (+) Transcript_66905:432-1067(+)
MMTGPPPMARASSVSAETSTLARSVSQIWSRRCSSNFTCCSRRQAASFTCSSRKATGSILVAARSQKALVFLCALASADCSPASSDAPSKETMNPVADFSTPSSCSEESARCSAAARRSSAARNLFWSSSTSSAEASGCSICLALKLLHARATPRTGEGTVDTVLFRSPSATSSELSDTSEDCTTSPIVTSQVTVGEFVEDCNIVMSLPCN